jgi:hypothetical protein
MRQLALLSILIVQSVFVQVIIEVDAGAADSRQWQIPLAGNAYLRDSAGRLPIQRDGTLLLAAQPEGLLPEGEQPAGEQPAGTQRRASRTLPADVTVYFHLDRAATIQISLPSVQSREGRSSPKLKMQLDSSVRSGKFDSETGNADFGEVVVERSGYVAAKIHVEAGQIAAKDLVVTSTTPNLTINCVANNKGNMFYWGRRGPSVHLGYIVPRDRDIEFAYSEITVPDGQAPIGSYFMANGFGEGYFGFQVNSPTERRVLFSVWSPFKTQDPSAIPPDQRIQHLASGDGVHVGKFGNEGAGGQSYLRYDWKAGRTYRFLTRVHPAEDNKTVYTCWFGDKERDEWLLIASFARPKTQTHLTRFHSFLENFQPGTGAIGRLARYHNVWVCDTQGHWTECVEAHFTKDATGSGGHRLDFEGGVEGSSFYLKNCGFFNPPAQQKLRLKREAIGEEPGIQFDLLPDWEQSDLLPK